MTQAADQKSASGRGLAIAVLALNAPLFVLGISHALIVTEPYWRSRPNPGSPLGTIWIIAFTLGPLGFACSLVLVAAGRWIGGPTYWHRAKSTMWVFAVAVAILGFIYATTH
jgi:hypothetical protein